MIMKRTLSFYTLFFIACMGVMRLSGVLSKIVIARYITPYEYGLITLVAISLPEMFQYFTNFCMHDLLSHSKEGKSYFGFAIIYSLIAALLVAVVIFVFHERFFTFLNLPLDIWKILFIAFFIALFPLGILVDTTGLFRGLKKYSRSSIIASLPSVLKLCLVLIAIYLLHITDFITILAIFAVSSAIALIIVLIRYQKPMILSLHSVNLPSRKIFFFGTSVFIVSLFGGLSQIFCKIVVSHDLGITWQGYFDVSLTLIAILSFAFAAMSFVSIPEATGAENKEEIFFNRGGLGDVVRGLFAFLIFCIILLYFYSIQFVELLFGHEYIAAADYVVILAIGYIFLFIQQFLAYMNVSFQDPKEYKSLIIATLVCLALFPLVTHIFIQFMGFSGAYISLTLFSIIYAVITILCSKDLSPLRALLQRIDRLLISSTVTFFFIYFFAASYFLYGIVASSCIFALLVFSLRYLDKELILGMFTKK